MADSTLCVACAQLPKKDRSLAVKTVRCPDCQGEFGVTSYGAAFRILPTKRRLVASPALILGSVICACLFSFALVMTGLGVWSHDQIVRPDRAPEPVPGDELARVKEVAVEKPFASGVNPRVAKQEISNLITRIRQENSRDPKQRDAFLLARMNERPELRGLPFVMGDACRISVTKAQSFQGSVQAVRDGLDRDMRDRAPSAHNEHTPFWNTYFTSTGNKGVDSEAGIAALSQILGPERQSMRASLVQHLASAKRAEATRVLVRSAVFDASSDVRLAAMKALKDRNTDQDLAITSEVLMQGLRYPLAIVSKRAANAIVYLDRKDLLPQVADFLGAPAPGDPEQVKIDNKSECVVREVVRINHHRNCLLCHPPSLTGSTQEVPGVIPIPGSPFPSSPSEAYGQAKSQGEPMVRADTTYLRQDFSVLMPVENHGAWPEMQRFDFLVRTRIVEGKELAALQERVQERAAGFLSENHKAALYVLTELTGQNAAPNAAAWHQVLAAAKAND